MREELGLEDDRPASDAARIARTSELVAEKATGTIWLFGDEMVDFSEGGRKFVAFLAARGDRGASAAEAGGAASPESLTPDVVGRKMRASVDRWVAKTYRRLGKPVPESVAKGLVVREGKSGYRLVVRGVVV